MDATTVVLVLMLGFAAPAPSNPNLDFSAGALTGWNGQGFALQTVPGSGTRKVYAVSSADGDTPGRTGHLERTLTVPAGAVFLRCRAQAVGKDAASGGKLDLQLLAGQELLPKQVYTNGTWRPTIAVLPAANGVALEYSWLVIGHVGKPLRLVLRDDDARPGCHLHCSGFRFLTHADLEAQEFSQFMVKLQRQHKLAAMNRYDTAHFTALSNADEEFSKARLQNCEMLYRRFFDHFRAKGFTIKEPATRLMVAVFDNEAGFKAYVGPQEVRGAQGFYHTQTNRLVVYDYRENRQFLSARQRAVAQGKQLTLQAARDTYQDTVDRQAREFAADQNVSLIIHEAAHQLSFNCGLFNRDGDAPFWVVEGFACYCEPTEAGRWLGIGQPNLDRLSTLARANGALIPLSQLLNGDGWKAASTRETLLYYAQSWALFQLLLDERPQALRNYLMLIYPRRTPDHRLTDFQQVFGADLTALEKRLHAWVRTMVERNAPPRR